MQRVQSPTSIEAIVTENIALITFLSSRRDKELHVRIGGRCQVTSRSLEGYLY